MVPSNLPPSKAAPGPARGRSRQRENGLVDGREAGVVAHQLVAELIGEGIYRPTPEDVFVRVARHPLTQRAIVYRQAARQRLRTAVSLYFRFFGPDPAWSLIGTEIPGRGCRFDLAWELPSGEVLVDELKTGRIATVAQESEIIAQAARLCAAGATRWRDGFVGVRVLILGAPRQSFLARIDGTSEPLIDEVSQ